MTIHTVVQDYPAKLERFTKLATLYLEDQCMRVSDFI